MVAQPVTEDKTEPREVNSPNMEIAEWTTQSVDGDYYDCEKISHAPIVFACGNLTTDGTEIQLSTAQQANGQLRVAITPSVAVTSGYLVIFGRK